MFLIVRVIGREMGTETFENPDIGPKVSGGDLLVFISPRASAKFLSTCAVAHAACVVSAMFRVSPDNHWRVFFSPGRSGMPLNQNGSRRA
jgi:hypothetical protein